MRPDSIIDRALAAKPTTPGELRRLRARMDRLNRRLAGLLQERALLACRIGRSKQALGLAAADPRRERAMLAQLLREAPAGFSKRDLARIFREVFARSRALVVRDRRRRV